MPSQVARPQPDMQAQSSNNGIEGTLKSSEWLENRARGDRTERRATVAAASSEINGDEIR